MKKLIALLLVGGLVAAWAVYWRPRQARTEAASPKYDAVGVERGRIVLTVLTTARVVANLDVEIKCKASGEIVALPFDVSDPVKKGELLIELDPIAEQRLVQQAEVALRVSAARLAQARLNLKLALAELATEGKRARAALKLAQARFQDARAKSNRLQQLLGKKLASPEEYETARTAAVQTEVEVENAQIRIEALDTQKLALELKRQDIRLVGAQGEGNRIALEAARQRLSDTKVFAPIDGVVSARNVQRGQIISSGISNVGGGTPVLTLSDLSRVFLVASVDESDIGKVQTGQRARVTLDAFPAERFRGRVVRIATRGVNTSNVVTFEVRVEVHGRNKTLLKPEMTANVELIAAEKDDVLLVPAEAVRRRRGKRHVRVVKAGGGYEERPVEVGISDGVKTEILSGLSEDEAVVVSTDGAESRWRKTGSQRGRRTGRTLRMMFGGRRGRK